MPTHFPDTTLLSRSHAADAGCDIAARETVHLFPHAVQLVDTGVVANIPRGHFGLVYPRSSYAARGVCIIQAPIDAGYEGTIRAIVHLATNAPVTIQAGQRWLQMVTVPCAGDNVEAQRTTPRGSGGLGSTGN